MKQINQDKKSDRIIYLLAELNSTLDLYYETAIESEVASLKHKL